MHLKENCINEDKHSVWPSHVHLFWCTTIPCSVTLVQAWDILANFVMIITNNKSILQAIIVEVISEKRERGTNVHNVHNYCYYVTAAKWQDRIEVPTSQWYYTVYSVFSRYSPVMNALTTAHCLPLQKGKKIIKTFHLQTLLLLLFAFTDHNLWVCHVEFLQDAVLYIYISFTANVKIPWGKTYRKENWDMVEFFRLKYKHNLVAIYLNFALDLFATCTNLPLP